MPKHDIYLYAVAEPNEYDIHFDANWWVWSMADLHMKYDEKKSLPDNEFTRDWFTFKWWSTNSWWPEEFENQTEVINLTATHSWVVTLYAQRESEISYTIEYCLERLTWSWCDIVEIGTGYGSEWTGIILTWMVYTWFTLQTWDEVDITSGWIVQYRYIRNTYSLTLKDRNDPLINNIPTKYWAEILLPAEDPVWTWNTFSWWTNLPDDGTMPAYDLVITSDWIMWPHSITFNTDGWSYIPPFTGNYWDPIVRPPNPTKDGYEFVWWWLEPLPTTISWDDIEVTAVWRKINNGSSGGWRSGRWRRDSWDDDNGNQNEDNNQQHGSADTQSWNKTNILPKVDMEEIIAYRWAKKNGIIDDSWADSYPDGYLTRWDMAEMVVRFATNILWREIPTEYPWKCTWDDPKNQRWSPDTQVYANKACRLWLMWMWMKEFMPNKTVDRAEFWTILSRLLRWHMYDVINPSDTNPYYVKHLDVLNREWIMKNIENPTEMLERRKWVWMMMMRTAQKMPKWENAESQITN